MLRVFTNVSLISFPLISFKDISRYLCGSSLWIYISKLSRNDLLICFYFCIGLAKSKVCNISVVILENMKFTSKMCEMVSFVPMGN